MIINNTIYGNTAGGCYFEVLRTLVENNIVGGSTTGIQADSTNVSASVIFNDVWGNGDNWVGAAAPYATALGNLSVDPLFANSTEGDFRLRSEAGRYDLATAAWIRDTVTSPCIDAGDSASAWANEPQPNGGRINMGADGNTPFASKSLPTLTGVMDLVTKDFVLSWGCAPAGNYTVLYSSSLAGPWLEDLPGCQMTAGSNQTTLTFTNINSGSQSSRFYRVRWNIP